MTSASEERAAYGVDLRYDSLSRVERALETEFAGCHEGLQLTALYFPPDTDRLRAIMHSGDVDLIDVEVQTWVCASTGLQPADVAVCRLSDWSTDFSFIARLISHEALHQQRERDRPPGGHALVASAKGRVSPYFVGSRSASSSRQRRHTS